MSISVRRLTAMAGTVERFAAGVEELPHCEHRPPNIRASILKVPRRRNIPRNLMDQPTAAARDLVNARYDLSPTISGLNSCSCLTSYRAPLVMPGVRSCGIKVTAGC